MELGADELVIDGAQFGDAGKCYLGVFPTSSSIYQSEVHIGALAFKRRYVWYDARPSLEHGQGFNYISMQTKNKSFASYQPGQKQYNSEF